MNPRFRFHSLAAARRFRDRAHGVLVILHGDDGRYWLATGREAEALLGAGHEAIR